MSTRVTSSRLIGRAGELAELEAALADASAGRPSLAFLAGESGVGKSRLLSAFAARARADGGARILSGDCVELGEGELPYAPIVAALRPLVRAPEPLLDALAPTARRALEGLMPGLGEPAPEPSDAAAAQGRLFEALLSLLEALGREAPVVLAIEDLHWADRSTRAFLAFLGRSLCDERVLVLATYRSDELHRRHPLRPLLAELERDVRARRIELAPLTREELAELLTDILGASPGRGLEERLFARGGGNPLFTEELLAAGLDGRGAPPSTLREALMVRVERLPDAAQELLRVLAAGRRLDHGLLAEASGLEPTGLRDALREAVAGHIVVADEEGRYAFRHALLREVVHDDLLPGEHAALHAALAAALERRIAAEGEGAHLTAAAAHHHQAAGDRPAALAASVRAAGAAERVHAHGEALALLERALELWAQVEDAEAIAGADRAEVLARAAKAADAHGELVRAEALMTAAIREVDEREDPRRAAALADRLARTQRHLGRGDESLATVRHGLELLSDDGPSVERARLLSQEARIRILHGRYAEGIVIAREAQAAARAVGDRIAEARALNALGSAEAASGDVEAGIAALREAIRLNEERAHEHSDGYVNLADVLLLHGRHEEAMAVAAEGAALEGLSRTAADWLTLSISEIAFAAGDWETADRHLPPTGRRAMGTTLALSALRRAELTIGRGEDDAARAELEAAAPVIEQTSESQFHGWAGVMRAELALRAGDVAGGREAVQDALDRLEFCSDDLMRLAQVAAAGVTVEADAAQLARDLGDRAALAAAQEAAYAMLARVEAAAIPGRPVEAALLAGSHAEATRAVGRPDAAAYAQAAQAWDRVGRPYPAAILRWREADAQVVAGDREAASVALESARAVAERLGAHWLRREVENLAARARLTLGGEGPGPAEPAPGGGEGLPFGLTPRELQVLGLVARGATNREIGAELYMAEKTASVHVSRILGKLDVRSRTEAAAVAHRHGLEGAPVH